MSLRLILYDCDLEFQRAGCRQTHEQAKPVRSRLEETHAVRFFWFVVPLGTLIPNALQTEERSYASFFNELTATLSVRLVLSQRDVDKVRVFQPLVVEHGQLRYDRL